MPPGKKKKKLPTRGVMTTSVPSKTQTAAAAAAAAAEAEAEAKQQAEIQSQFSSTIPENAPVIASWQQAVQSEQDTHDTELQGLLDKFGPKTRKDSQRWTEKLTTERRMLRTAGAAAGLVWPLYVDGLLGLSNRSEDSVGVGEQIFQLARKETENAWLGRESKILQDGPVAEALLAQAWTIFRTLTSLGFPEGKVEKAIEEVIGKGKVGSVSGKWDRLPSQILGPMRGGECMGDLSLALLEEVMDWLALECNEDELPSFDGVVREKREDKKESGEELSQKGGVKVPAPGPESGAATPVLKDYRQEISKKEKQIQPNRPPSQSQVPSSQQTPKSIPSSKLSLEPLDIEDARSNVGADIDMPYENVSPEEGADSDDDDIPPEELLPRWLELKKKYLKLEPTATFGNSKKRGSKATEDPKIKSLKERIQKIERDPFFDTRLAGDAWAKEMTKMKDSGDLQATFTQQAQGRRAAGRKKNDWWAEKDEEKKEPDVPEPAVEEDDGLFGGLEMFEGARVEEVLIGTEEKVIIRDFEQAQNAATAKAGKFNKSAKNKLQANATATAQVKKVVEETVKSKDTWARVTFTSTSGTTYSSRHSLAIRWSRPAYLASFLKSAALPTSTSAPYPLTSAQDVVMKIDGEAVTFSMTKLSAPSAAQSEAYISTAVLYQLYGGSTCAGGNGYMRLQGTWRDLWAEFAEQDKAEEERAEREILERLRKLILSENGEKKGEASAGEVRKKKKVKENDERSVEGEGEQGEGEEKPLADWEKRVVGEVLKAEWGGRVNSGPYQHMLDYRKQLPIWSFKDEILNTLDKEQVIIICGETGCGKSTQVPAFILENELSNGRACRVYCTEPRRISAISLARRVSQELGEGRSDLGSKNSLVGYAIRLESCMGSWTRLVYATTGIVMRMLEGQPKLGDVTHLVLDEVHERSIDSDFLLIVLKKLLSKRRDLKVILMSATVDAERFSCYLNNAPVLNVPGRMFPVTTQFLEDAIELTKYTIDERDARISKNSGKYGDDWDDGVDEESNENTNRSLTVDALSNYSKETKTTLSRINEYQIQYELIVKLIETVATHPQYVGYSKAILVFLPGIGEIRKLNDYLLGHPVFGGHGAYGGGKRERGRGGGYGGWLIYPLHSTIASEEQEAAFLIPPEGMRKIVLATNIAETGITIPDVTCVIDSGKHKEMRFDERRQLSRLIETFIARANAKQRGGRAGRVQEGLCFHLFTKERYESFMAPQQVPELLRLSLQDLCLRVKICNLGPIEETLLMALDPPLPRNIRRAVDSLIEVKALTSFEELTPLGRQLSKLPLDVYLGKLVLYGWVHGCLDAAVTIAAILSSKSPFQAPMASRQEAEAAKLAFKKGYSDLQTIYNAYCAWRRICSGLSQNLTENQFCQKNYLSSRTLNTIEDLKGQLITCIVDAGFLSLNREEKQSLGRSRFQTFRRNYFFTLPHSVDAYSENENIVNSVIAAGFYPKLLVRDGRGWRNIANNQTIKIHPGSVNRVNTASTWLSYYGIMQSNMKYYDAHETSHVDDLTIALLCGDVDFKGFAGVLMVDGHRIKFSLERWKGLLAVKILRGRLGELMKRAFRDPERVNERRVGLQGKEKEKLESEKEWIEIVGEVLGAKRKVGGA